MASQGRSQVTESSTTPLLLQQHAVVSSRLMMTFITLLMDELTVVRCFIEATLKHG